MLIFIRTPLYRLSKFIPHLIEHCINRDTNVNSEIYFDFIHNTDFKSFSNYTILKIPDYIDLNIFIKKIMNKINKSTIRIEKKVLKQELIYISYENKLFEKICKKVYWNNFNINKVNRINFDEIYSYHKKYYNLNNFIICDDNYNIIKDDYIYQKIDKLEVKNDKFKINVNWYKNFVIISEYKSWKDYYFNFFLEELINSFIDFKYRFNKNIYLNNLEAYFYRTDEINIFILGWWFDIDFSMDFFNKFKNNFINIISYDYWKKWIIINKLLLWINLNNNEIIDYINELDYYDVVKYLWNELDYKTHKKAH